MGGTPRQRKKLGWVQETVLLIALALVVSVVVKAFLVQMFFVPSASMRPELIEDDRILVEKVSTWDGEVERGDVVVFKDPGGWLGAAPELTGMQRLLSTVGLYPQGGHLVKRVIAVGGDRVVCCDRKGRIILNGRALQEEEYVRDGTAPSGKRFDVVVPDDSIWVMGDNRSNSEDSRFHMDLPGNGTIDADSVVGKGWVTVWPPGRWTHVTRPETFEQDRRTATSSG